jgi:hypothetical protein
MIATCGRSGYLDLWVSYVFLSPEVKSWQATSTIDTRAWIAEHS